MLSRLAGSRNVLLVSSVYNLYSDNVIKHNTKESQLKQNDTSLSSYMIL